MHTDTVCCAWQCNELIRADECLNNATRQPLVWSVSLPLSLSVCWRVHVCVCVCACGRRAATATGSSWNTDIDLRLCSLIHHQWWLLCLCVCLCVTGWPEEHCEQGETNGSIWHNTTVDFLPLFFMKQSIIRPTQSSNSNPVCPSCSVFLCLRLSVPPSSSSASSKYTAGFLHLSKPRATPVLSSSWAILDQSCHNENNPVLTTFTWTLSSWTLVAGVMIQILMILIPMLVSVFIDICVMRLILQIVCYVQMLCLNYTALSVPAAGSRAGSWYYPRSQW